MSKRLIELFLSGLLVLIGLLSLVSLLLWDYPWELLSSFRVYYFLIACLIAGVMAIAWQSNRRRNKLLQRLLSLALAIAAFNSIWIIPWYLTPHHQSSGEFIRVLTFNINIQNDHWDKIADSVSSVKPDIVTILESSLEAQQQLSPRLNQLLPFVYRTSGGGLTVFSRFPLISPQSQTFNHGTILFTSLRIKQNIVKLIAAHPIAPINRKLFHRRNALLAEITTYLQKQSDPLIFLADLNLTPWSPYYRRLIQKTGLRNTRLGFGIEPSWLENTTFIRYPQWFISLMAIPIDHILVRGNINVVDCRTAKGGNSDHRMLWSDLIF